MPGTKDGFIQDATDFFKASTDDADYHKVMDHNYYHVYIKKLGPNLHL